MLHLNVKKLKVLDAIGAGLIGLGQENATIAVFIGNWPPLPEYQQLKSLRPLQPEELTQRVMHCGNHWRKIFNCYAKLVFSLHNEGFTCWQDYRDMQLLQLGSPLQLRFDRDLTPTSGVNIICGRRHAESFKLPQNLCWLDAGFAIDVDSRLIVSPYFDYRQLSNLKLAYLGRLIKSLL